MKRAGAVGSVITALGLLLAANQPTTHTLGLLDIAAPFAQPIEQKYSADGREIPVGLPARFRWGSMPAVLNQGDTPRCVAFSTSTVKAWQDRLEWGRFYNFDEAKFARQIGTTAVGAYMSRALVQLDDYGYPVVNVGQRSKHRILEYWSVPVNAGDIKRAVAEYGPVLVIGWWYDSWWQTRRDGILRAPTSIAGGHAYVVYGWDNDRGLRIRNSWGTGWGLDGDGFLPYAYVTSAHIFGVYVTVDEITAKATPDPTAPPTPDQTVTVPETFIPSPTLNPSPPPSATAGSASSPAPTVVTPVTPEPPDPVERDSPVLLFLALIAFGAVSAYVLLRKP